MTNDPSGFLVQQVESYWIDVRSIRRDRYSPEESCLTTEDPSQRGGRAHRWYWRQTEGSHTAGERRRIHVPCGLVRNEEKGPVPGPGYGPAQSGAGLVTSKVALGDSRCICKEVVRVQRVIATEIVRVPMELRRARFGLDEHVRAAARPY